MTLSVSHVSCAEYETAILQRYYHYLQVNAHTVPRIQSKLHMYCIGSMQHEPILNNGGQVHLDTSYFKQPYMLMLSPPHYIHEDAVLYV